MYPIIKTKYCKILAYFYIPMALFSSCTEPFDASGVISDFESVLVIEATITNELKQQKISLTRSFEFGVNRGESESGAEVVVSDSQGNEFEFTETEPGIYLSDQEFRAFTGTDYRLSVTTNDSKRYASSTAQLTQVTPIGSVIAERTVSNGQDGVAIMVNTFDPTNNSNFYRYEYEETYKIIAPNWTSEDIVASSNDPTDCNVQIIPLEDDIGRICYKTNLSNRIILANTAGQLEDQVSQFLIRFINRDNYILSHRYSILVRQFVQSPAAHTFFETLSRLSENENLFSQIQPGLIVGNVFSENNENEVVLGYFEVASLSQQRIFFDYEDFFEGESLPPFVNDCISTAPPLDDSNGNCILSNVISNGGVEYLAMNDPPSEELPGPFLLVPSPCGDCTILGSSIVPNFWTD